MTAKQGHQLIKLFLPEKSTKKRKGYYIPQDVIDFIKSVADKLSAPGPSGSKKELVSENDVLTAIIRSYINMIETKIDREQK